MLTDSATQKHNPIKRLKHNPSSKRSQNFPFEQHISALFQNYYKNNHGESDIKDILLQYIKIMSLTITDRDTLYCHM